MKNIIAYYGIGSGANPPVRNIGWGIPEGGWKPFVERFIKPLIDLGVTRFQLHNPGGTLPNEEMQADQFVEAKKAGLTWVYKDFVKAWKPITDKYEVIAYLGTLPEADLKALQDKRKYGSYARRVTESYYYPLEAGCSIAFDAMHHNLEKSPEYHYMRMQQGLGVRTYIEPWPNVNCPHFWNCNTEFVLSNYHHKMYRDGSWAAPVEKMTGERIVLLNYPPSAWEPWVPSTDFDKDRRETMTWANEMDWCPAWCRMVQAQGMTPLVAMYKLIEMKIPLEKWLAPMVS